MQSNNQYQVLNDLIEKRKKEIFVKEYLNKASDPETLGVIISQFFNYTGRDIINCFLSALEDSNYHDLRAKIKDITRGE